jgi:hypothetical protein
MTQHNQMACEHLLDYLLGELNDAEVMAFQYHARHCPSCHEEMMSILPVHSRLSEDEIDVPGDDWFATHKSILLQPALESSPPRNTSHGRIDEPINQEPVRHTAPVEFRSQTLTQTLTRGRRVGRWRYGRMWVSTMVAGLLILLVGGGFVWFRAGSQKSPTTNPPVSFVQKVALQANPGYPSAHGIALVTNNHDEPNLILYVSNLPQQSSWGCYDLWGVQGGKRYSLGEFTVDAQGTGALSVKMPINHQYESIEVTLEPYWGDSQPQGPQVLAALWGNA